MFLPHDAEEITNIKVPTNEIEDTIAWHYEKKGKFTIKSAYKLAENFKKGATTNSNAPNGERKMWRSIWTVPVLNKVRVFSWRLACHNLPTQK
jgi:hypothetical protein